VDLNQRGQRIDRVTLAHELMNQKQLESVDGLTYLSQLDEGLPQIANLDSYVAIVSELSAKRKLLFTCNNAIQRVLTDKTTTCLELSNGLRCAMEGLGDAREDRDLILAGDVVTNHPGGLQGLMTPHKGLMTGYYELDAMTGGLQSGELFIVAARPSMGKSAWLANVAENLAIGPRGDGQKSVAVFSAEMSAKSFVVRLLCSRARVDHSRQRAGFMNSEERRRLNLADAEVRRSRLFIDDTSAITVSEMHRKLRRLKLKRGLDLVGIDYLQLLTPDSDAQNREQEVSAMSRAIKIMAGELDVPVILLSQLNRANESRKDKIPMLSDLRESGAIEQDADLVAFIFREEVYEPLREDLRGVAKLILAKQRNGPIAHITLTWLKQFTRFENPVSAADMQGAA